MSTDPSRNAKAAAVTLVEDANPNLSYWDLAPIIKAVAEDIAQRETKSDVDEAKVATQIAKVEAQTHVLADAVVAMTETAESLAPAVKAVKDEM